MLSPSRRHACVTHTHPPAWRRSASVRMCTSTQSSRHRPCRGTSWAAMNASRAWPLRMKSKSLQMLSSTTVAATLPSSLMYLMMMMMMMSRQERWATVEHKPKVQSSLWCGLQFQTDFPIELSLYLCNFSPPPLTLAASICICKLVTQSVASSFPSFPFSFTWHRCANQSRLYSSCRSSINNNSMGVYNNNT